MAMAVVVVACVRRRMLCPTLAVPRERPGCLVRARALALALVLILAMTGLSWTLVQASAELCDFAT